MSIIYISYIRCPLQSKYQPEEFVELYEMQLQREQEQDENGVITDEMFSHFSEQQRDALIQLQTGKTVTSSELDGMLEEISKGITECEACKINITGKPVGCRGVIATPLQAAFEQSIIDFFVSDMKKGDQAMKRIVEKVLMPMEGTFCIFEGTERTHGEPPLTEAPFPFEAKYGGLFRKKTVNSGRLLGAFFKSLYDRQMKEDYLHFFSNYLKEMTTAGDVSLKRSQTFREVKQLVALYKRSIRFFNDFEWIVQVF